jgi:glycosyltransferase involved in cell wall biosynthesis
MRRSYSKASPDSPEIDGVDRVEPTARILTIADHLGALGGTETAQVAIFEGLAARGWRVALLYVSAGDLWSRWRVLAESSSRVPAASLAREAPFRSALGMFRTALAGLRARPDVIYLHSPAGLPAGLLVRSLLSVPIVLHLHQPPSYRQAQWMNRLIRRADRIVVPSRDTADRWQGEAHSDPAAMAIVPMGIDVGRFTPMSADERSAVRRTLGVDADIPIVLYVGRIERIKGTDHLLRAAAQMRVPTQIVLCGAVTDDAYFSSLEGSSLDHPPLFLGRRPDVATIMAAADLLVMPSVGFETQGLALSESMACGTPAVAYDIGALASSLEGFPDHLVPLGDEAGLAQAMDRLVNWRAESPDLGGRSRDWVVRNMTVEGTIASISRVIQSALTGQAVKK